MSRPLLLAVGVVVLLVLAVTLILVDAGGQTTTPVAAAVPAPAPTPAAAPSSLLVRTGTVSAVNDDGTVQVGAEHITLAGLATPAAGACGHDVAIDAERNALLGQAVTLVPDPAVPTPGVAHVVTHAQLSYTDAALANGMGRPAPGAWTYAAVFKREADDARTNDVGLWTSCSSGP